jgi:hypothetical protein
MAEEEKKGGIKVNDRRRFDTEGNERSDSSSVSPGPNPVASSSNKSSSSDAQAARGKISDDDEVGFAEEEMDDTDEGTGDIEFSSFIMSLMTQALMQLGAVEPPAGVEVQVDKAGAKQCIDILALIQRKTKGNLDSVEEKLMEEILHNLRMAFVRFA